VRRTSGEAHAVDDESSGVEPEGFREFVSSSPLDDGEEISLSLLGGGSSRATEGLVAGNGMVLVEAAEAAERSVLRAVEKASSLPFGSDVGPTEEAGEGLEASIRDRTDRTLFLF